MRRGTGVCVLLVAISVGVSVVWAEGGDGILQHDRDGFCRCHEAERMPPPPLPPEAWIDHMAKRLRLSCEQQKKIGEIFEKEREKVAPVLKNQREYQQQLQSAISAAKYDESAIRAVAVKQAQTDVELTVSRARLWNQVNSLLTPEQRVLAAKNPPPFHHPFGPKSFCAGDMGPGHMPPPPAGEQRYNHSGSGME